MFLSFAHSHFVETTFDNGIEVQITKDTNECIICASHFKISVSSDTDSTPIAFQWDTVEHHTQPAVDSPEVGIHNDRAPPFVVHG